MADTFTPNINLILPDLADTFNFATHVESNFSTIDSMMGAVSCTSATRPSNTYAGQIVYETDSKRYVQNTGTRASPTWTYMSHAALSSTSSAHPTSGLSAGLLVYESDLKTIQVYNGSGFTPVSTPYPCTSSTRPAAPFTGAEIFETDTGLQAFWNGTTWRYITQVVASLTVGSNTASITLSGIPASHNFMQLEWRTHLNTGGATDLLMRVDGVSSALYVWSKMEAASAVQSNFHAGAAATSMKIGACSGTTASYFSSGSLSISGWVTGTGFLSCAGVSSCFDSNTSDFVGTYGGLYAGTGPHTSITILPAANSFIAGSMFSLVGVG